MPCGKYILHGSVIPPTGSRRRRSRKRGSPLIQAGPLTLHPLRMNVNALWTPARAIKG
ncbi:MAG TPA: hypothetical protein VN380_21480 [Thermoanaerobaculia bacterium]|jgi:hypothetical protein|nr:hypothetical protein [Thermoanaerobaculia bacterium]